MYEQFCLSLIPLDGLEPHKLPQTVDSSKVLKDLAHYLSRIDAKPDSEDARFSWFGLTDRGS